MRKRRKYRVAIAFDDSVEHLDPVTVEYQLLEQHARLLCSNEPRLQGIAKRYLRGVAELAISARISKRIETRSAGSASVVAKRSKNAPRDRRIHDAHARGSSQKAISLDEKCSESTVSRVLKKPRP